MSRGSCRVLINLLNSEHSINQVVTLMLFCGWVNNLSSLCFYLPPFINSLSKYLNIYRCFRVRFSGDSIYISSYHNSAVIYTVIEDTKHKELVNYSATRYYCYGAHRTKGKDWWQITGAKNSFNVEPKSVLEISEWGHGKIHLKLVEKLRL